MDFWSPPTKAQQAVKVRVSLYPDPDPADIRVQPAKKKTTQKTNLKICSRGLMGGASGEFNLNPVETLV